ncbi:GNAT family N-acetyltransferase [Streptococcus dentapri]|uniref:GNAT family N-acetyltransferase n=1 Tax=Streptococcus dentapri TaxID=573564 RepID=A0ABV8D2D6_9STRE
MELRRPQVKDKESVLAMMLEFEQESAAHDGGFWDTENFDYEEWLEQNFDHELGLNLVDGMVPSIQFVAFSDDGKALGFLSLRLRLNDSLMMSGGHIGYSVRPSQRKRGIAKAMLTQALQVCQSKNIKKVLVTCHSDNLASRAVILANGGQLEDVRNGIERYWIEVEAQVDK